MGPSGLSCESELTDCQANQIVNTQGRCEDCPVYYHAEETEKKECIQDECGPFEIITVLGKCERCPEGAEPNRFTNQRECIFKSGDRQFFDKLGNPPDWAAYRAEDTSTSKLQTYWETPGVAGGSLLDDLTYNNADGSPSGITVATPLRDTVYQTATYGYFEIG